MTNYRFFQVFLTLVGCDGGYVCLPESRCVSAARCLKVPTEALVYRAYSYVVIVEFPFQSQHQTVKTPFVSVTFPLCFVLDQYGRTWFEPHIPFQADATCYVPKVKSARSD